MIALLQALALWGLHESLKSGIWPASDPGWLFALYLFVAAVPLTLQLLWAHHRERMLWIATASLSVFVLWSGRYVLAGVPGPVTAAVLDEDVIAGYVLPFVVAWLIALPLLRARLECGRWAAPYATLFRAAWRSCLTLAESALFTGVFWGLLALWGALFSVLGNDFFRELFADPRFVYPATTLAVALAIRIIGTSDRLVDGVLDQLLGLMKWLAPLAGLVVILFTAALLPKLPTLFADGEKIINSGILLALVAITLLLLNAAYRDGEQEPEYGTLLKRLMRVVPPALVVVALTGLVSMAIRTVDLGLTPPRFWGLVTSLFAVLFALGYAIAALRRGPWLGEVRRVNFLVSVLLLVVLLASLTPIGSPLRWSIANQVSRAMTADAADRDGALRFLRFDAGAPGRDALDKLAGGVGGSAVNDALRSAAARIAALKSRALPASVDPSATPARYAAWRQKLRTLPADRPLPQSLEALLQREFTSFATTLDPGGNAPPPTLVFIDLDADGDEDALLLSGTLLGEPQMVRDYRAFIFEPTGWQLVSVGSLSRRDPVR